MIQLTTSRLILRPYQTGDEDAFYSFLNFNRQHLIHVLPQWVYQIRSVSEAAGYIRQMQAGWLLKNYLSLGIWLKQKHILAGEVVLFNIEWNISELEIGVYIARDYQNLGLITEAATATEKYLFGKLGIKRIKAVCSVDNKPSQRVFQKCNYDVYLIKDDCICYLKQNSG